MGECVDGQSCDLWLLHKRKKGYESEFYFHKMDWVSVFVFNFKTQAKRKHKKIEILKTTAIVKSQAKRRISETLNERFSETAAEVLTWRRSDCLPVFLSNCPVAQIAPPSVDKGTAIKTSIGRRTSCCDLIKIPYRSGNADKDRQAQVNK